MNIKKLANKKIVFSMCLLIALIFIILLKQNVFKKNAEASLQNEHYNDEVRNLLFDIGCQAISGEACYNKNIDFPYSSSLKIILNHSYVERGCIRNILDRYFPSCLGIAESSGFYNPIEDKADWVEETLVRAEEERIAAEIREMEENLEEFQDGTDLDLLIDNNDEEMQPALENEGEGNTELVESAPEIKISQNSDDIVAALEKEFDGKIISDKNSKMKILESDGEILIPMETYQGFSIVQASGSSVIRRFYNDKHRITKKEVWKIDSIEVEKPETSEEYNYEADGETISSKLIDSGSDYTLINYYSNGLAADIHRYIIMDGKRYTLQKRKCTYDDKQNIISDENIDYVYTDDTYKKIKYTFSKKYVYEYNGEDISPDYKYYENGIMKMHNKYSVEKGTYTSQIYFDDNLSVKAYYENNLHVRDVYYRAGNIIREKVYEENKQSE